MSAEFKCIEKYAGTDLDGEFQEFVFQALSRQNEFDIVRTIRKESFGTENYEVGKFYNMRMVEVENNNPCPSTENPEESTGDNR